MESELETPIGKEERDEWHCCHCAKCQEGEECNEVVCDAEKKCDCDSCTDNCLVDTDGYDNETDFRESEDIIEDND